MISPEEKIKILEEEILRNSVRNPGLAVLLSFFLPGLGQIYNGKISKGLLFIFSHLLLLFFGYQLFFNVNGEINIFFADLSILPFVKIIYLIVHFLFFFYNLRDSYLEAKFSGLVARFSKPQLVQLDGQKCLLLGYEENNLPVLQQLPAGEGNYFDENIKITYAWRRIFFFVLVVFFLGIFVGKAVFNRIEKIKVKSKENFYLSKLQKKPQNIELLLEYSNYLIKKGKYYDAMKYLKKVILKDPQNSRAHFSLGLVYHNLGLKEKEDEEFRKFILISNNQAFSSEALINDWLNAIRENPKNANALYNLAKIYYSRKMYKEALFALQRALENKPDYLECYLLLGDTFKKMKNWEQAYFNYKKALGLKPDDLMIVSELAHLTLKLRKYQEADTYWEILYQKGKLSGEEMFIFLKNKIAIGEKEQAKKILNKYLSSKKNVSLKFLKLKLNLLPQDDYKQRILVLEQLRKLSPQDDDIIRRLLNLYAKTNNFIKGKLLLENIGADFFQKKENLKVLIGFFRLAEERQKEKDTLKQLLLKEFPLDESDFSRFAYLVEFGGFSWEDIQFVKEKLLPKFPNNLKILTFLAKAYRVRKNITAEIEILKKMIIINPKDLQSLKRLADIYKKKEKKEEALVFYKEMLSLNPDNLEVLQNISELYEELGLKKKLVETLMKIWNLEKGKDLDILKKIYRIANANSFIDELKWSLEKLLSYFPQQQKYASQLAKLYSQEHNYKKAITIWEKILKDNPISQVALYKLKDLYQRSHQKEKLKGILEKIIFYNRDDIQSIEELARIYQQTGEIKQEMLLWENLLHLYPFQLNALRRLSELYQKTDNWVKLVSVLEKLISIDEKNKNRYLEMLFNTYLKLGSSQKIIEIGEKLLAFKKRYSQRKKLLKKLVPYYLQQRDFTKLIKVYEEIYRNEPQNKEALKSLIALYEKKRAYQKAKKYLEKLSKLKGMDREKIKRKLLEILITEGNFKESKKLFLELVDKNNFFKLEDHYLYKLLKISLENKDYQFVKQLISQGKSELLQKTASVLETLIFDKGIATPEQLNLIEFLLEKGYGSNRLSYLVGKFYYEKGNYDKALSYLKKAKVEEGDLRNKMLAEIYWKKGQKLKAIYYFKESLKYKEKQPDVKFKIAKIYMDAYQYKTAVKWFNKSLDDDKTNAEAYRLIGILYKRMKNYKEAERYYELSLKYLPDSLTYYYLAYVLERQDRFDDAWKAYLEGYQVKDKKIKKRIVKRLLALVDRISMEGLENSLSKLQNVLDEKLWKKLFLLLANNGKKEEAVKIALDLLEKDEHFSPALNFLGNYYFNKGDYRKSLNFYLKLPQKDGILFKEAILYQNMGKIEDAKKLLKLLLKSKDKKLKKSAQMLLKSLK